MSFVLWQRGKFTVIDIFSYLDMQTVLILFFTFALIYSLRKLLAYRSAIRSVQYVKTNEATLSESWHPFVRNISGYRVFLSPTSALGYILPRIPVICRGNNHFFEDKHARALICTDEWQHKLNPLCSLWICWLGCDFHSQASLAVCATWTLDLLLIQVSSFPKDEPTLVLADAAAIKVKNFKPY